VELLVKEDKPKVSLFNKIKSIFKKWKKKNNT